METILIIDDTKININILDGLLNDSYNVVSAFFTTKEQGKVLVWGSICPR